MADIEKIKQALRAHVEKHKDRERAMFTVAGVRALLDELSRLTEVERRAKYLANAFYVFTIEDDDGIRLSTGGMVVAHYSEHPPEGIALLKLEAASRALSERKEGQAE